MELHFLDARGALTELRPWITDRLSHAHEVAAPMLSLQNIDVVVQAGRFVIPEKGHVGYAHEGGVIHLTVDPSNPELKRNAKMSLERMLAHELHHCARWDGPPRERILGEALVAEGLACHFAQEVFGEPLEPWEALPEEQIFPHIAQANQDWAKKDYDHSAWFFGTSDLPRWLGYSLGYQLVAQFLKDRYGDSAASLACAIPSHFRPFLEALDTELSKRRNSQHSVHPHP